MSTSTPLFVPLEVYLRTSYRPDRDWIDGEAKERNIGEQSLESRSSSVTYSGCTRTTGSSAR